MPRSSAPCCCAQHALMSLASLNLSRLLRACGPLRSCKANCTVVTQEQANKATMSCRELSQAVQVTMQSAQGQTAKVSSHADSRLSANAKVRKLHSALACLPGLSQRMQHGKGFRKVNGASVRVRHCKRGLRAAHGQPHAVGKTAMPAGGVVCVGVWGVVTAAHPRGSAGPSRPWQRPGTNPVCWEAGLSPACGMARGGAVVVVIGWGSWLVCERRVGDHSLPQSLPRILRPGSLSAAAQHDHSVRPGASGYVSRGWSNMDSGSHVVSL